MTIKTFLIAFFIVFPQNIFTQNIVINTDSTKITFDVNGDLQVRKEIRLGGTEGNSGSAGRAGQVFTSRGSDINPIWTDIGQAATSYGIKESIVLTDEVGITITDTNTILNLTPAYLENSRITNNGWIEIAGLKSEVTPSKPNNRLLITLQTIAQSAATLVYADYEFAIGIFVDEELKCTRPIYLYGSDMVFNVGTLFDSYSNLPVKPNNKPYSIQVAIAIRYRNLLDPENYGIKTNDWITTIGTSNARMNNTNNWMNRTSLKIELFEEN